MLKKKVKKLWQGRFTSIRDYELKTAIKKGGLVIIHNREQMILNVDELRTLKPNPQLFQSKYTGKYRLVDITFKRNTLDHRQENLI